MWLNIHNLHKQDISRLSSLDLEWPREVMDLGKINVFNIVGTIIVS